MSEQPYCQPTPDKDTTDREELVGRSFDVGRETLPACPICSIKFTPDGYTAGGWNKA
ncbi:MAG: hypothetical protein Q4F65_11230 [Propionibacteriaceae bacterium]|nr:hypothetical protein [Propionibacteriaceae bacterium]